MRILASTAKTFQQMATFAKNNPKATGVALGTLALGGTHYLAYSHGQKNSLSADTKAPASTKVDSNTQAKYINILKEGHLPKTKDPVEQKLLTPFEKGMDLTLKAGQISTIALLTFGATLSFAGVGGSMIAMGVAEGSPMMGAFGVYFLGYAAITPMAGKKSIQDVYNS